MCDELIFSQAPVCCDYAWHLVIPYCTCSVPMNVKFDFDIMLAGEPSCNIRILILNVHFSSAYILYIELPNQMLYYDHFQPFAL